MKKSDGEIAQTVADWMAPTWSLSQVFDVFLLPQWEQLKGHLPTLIHSLGQIVSNPPSIGNEEQAIRIEHTRRALSSLFNLNQTPIDLDLELAPIIWLRLLHFVGESTGLRFQIMQDDYRSWRESLGNARLIIRRQNPDTGKWASRAVDLFLLQPIETLVLQVPYKWRILGDDVLEHDVDSEKREFEQDRKKRIAKIGSPLCEIVLTQLKRQVERVQGLSLMNLSAPKKGSKPDRREYQFQGSGVLLASKIKQTTPNLSESSDKSVENDVRTYVKCS